MCGLSWAKRVEAQKPQEGPGPGRELRLEITTEKTWARCGKMGEACQDLFVKIPLCVPLTLHGKTNICGFPSSCELFSFPLKFQTLTLFFLLRMACDPQLPKCVWSSHVFVGLLYVWNYICFSPINLLCQFN